MQDIDHRNVPHARLDEDHSRLALQWFGFGSPVGLGILAISIGIAAVLLRLALIGFQ